MLVPIVLAIILGIGIGRIRGGSLATAAAVRFRWSGLVLPALIMTLLPVFVTLDETLDTAATLAGFSMVGVFLAVNVFRSSGLLRLGLAVTALGWTLNLMVIGLNGGMPLSTSSYAASAQTAAPTPGQGGFYRIVLADDATDLRFLGDIIAVRHLRQVFSPGDLTLAFGLVLSVAGAMGPGQRRQNSLPSGSAIVTR